jgi:hypothetical protein
VAPDIPVRKPRFLRRDGEVLLARPKTKVVAGETQTLRR